MTVLTQEQSTALRLIVGAVLHTIKEAGPQGAPAGVLYAAMQGHGCKKAQFDSLMNGLVATGAIVRDGLVYRMAS